MTAGAVTATSKLSLKDFVGSKEETNIQVIFKWILGDIGTSGFYSPPEFFNLIIGNSNAAEGTSFTDASIFPQLIDDAQEAATEFGIPCCGTVSMKDMINASVISEFAAEGVNAIEKYSDSYRQAFQILFEFLRELTKTKMISAIFGKNGFLNADRSFFLELQQEIIESYEKRRHETSIKKLIKLSTSTSGNKESNITAALALHLFSQLIPSKMYEVDEFAKHIPTECECGCKSKIRSGNTSVGSKRTWHGRVDIVLNHTIAVAVRKEITITDDDSCRDEDTEDGCTNEDGPVRKKRKVDQCDICVEVKRTMEPSVLLDEKFLKQILAEAVTNSFAQVNMQSNTLKNFLIPTLGASSEEVSLCLYDSKNDYLLHIMQPLKLWSADLEQFDWQAIVVIWLFLNFTVFLKKDLHASISLEKSGLHEQLKKRLKFYRKAETKQNFTDSTSWNCLWQRVVGKPRPKLEMIPD